MTLALAAGCGGAVAGWFGALLLGWLRVPVYPAWCAAASAVVCGSCAFGTGPPWWSAVLLCLGWFGVLLAAADLRTRRLPNLLTGGACAALGGLLAAAPVLGADGTVLGRAGLGAALFGGAHLLVHLIAPAGLGAGDVKLAVALGAVLGVLGAPALVLGAALAAVLTVLLALGARLLGSRRWADGVPHGPGMLLATWLLAFLPGGPLPGGAAG